MMYHKSSKVWYHFQTTIAMLCLCSCLAFEISCRLGSRERIRAKTNEYVRKLIMVGRSIGRSDVRSTLCSSPEVAVLAARQDATGKTQTREHKARAARDSLVHSTTTAVLSCLMLSI